MRLLTLSIALLLFNFAEVAVGDSFPEKPTFPHSLKIENAWVKLAPPSASVNAAYLELHNPSSVSVTIMQITADCCGHVMLHETRIEGDKVAMHHLDELSIPAKSRVSMRPGGLHLMLMQIKIPLVVDAKVTFVLTFADGSQQQVEALVRHDE